MLDAVIDYGGELLVVVENKVAEADDRQARELNFTGARVRLADGQEAVVVLWRDVLEAFDRAARAQPRRRRRGRACSTTSCSTRRTTSPTSGRSGRWASRTATGSGRPAGCGSSWARRSAWTRSIDIYGPYIETPAGDAIGAKTYLRMTDDDEQVELALYPADTLSQARAFYPSPPRSRASPSSPAARLACRAELPLRPHAARLLLDDDQPRRRRVRRRYGRSEIGSAGAVPREDWDEYWAWLEKERIAAPEDRPEFDRHFIDTQRQTASPRRAGSSAALALAEAEASTPTARYTHRCAKRSMPHWKRSETCRSIARAKRTTPTRRSGDPQPSRGAAAAASEQKCSKAVQPTSSAAASRAKQERHPHVCGYSVPMDVAALAKACHRYG